jgi:hypothetical protein
MPPKRGIFSLLTVFSLADYEIYFSTFFPKNQNSKFGYYFVAP